MTRSEARTETSRQLSNTRETLKLAKSQGAKTRAVNKIDYLVAVQKALCGPTREMVERMRGEWIRHEGYDECANCSEKTIYGHNFCPRCGQPKTDEAVEMVMERMEALKDES